MIIDYCLQGSEEWLSKRAKIITSTHFKDIATSKYSKASGSNAYMSSILINMLNLEQPERFISEDMENGIVQEPKARAQYELINGVVVEEVGLVYKDEDRRIACSPDGLLAEKGLEIKCPKLKTHLKYHLDNKLPAEYFGQVQGSMWVTDFKEWDFMSYHPEAKPFIKTIKRDDKYMNALDKYVPKFIEEIDAALERLK